jgi:serine/threonine protein kinase
MPQSDRPDDGFSRDHELVALLVQLFDADELRRWARLALGEEVHRELPGVPVALNELALQCVRLGQLHGLVDEVFFARLRAERPAQARRVSELAEQWRDARHALPASGTPARRPSLHYLDERTRLLSEQLADEYVRKQSLEAAGLDTSEVVHNILRIKRKIRSGGQLRPGDRLGDNRYLLVERIGRGSSANVWKALDLVFLRDVAVKVLHGELAGDVIRRERFFRSARIMAELDHPAVVRIIEPHGEDDDFHYFVMELAAGGDLRRAVLDGRVDASALMPLLFRLGEGLAVAHAHGLVHRDIKPANVLLTESGDLRLADFNLVSVADAFQPTRVSGILLGTLVYAAPEMLDRPQEVDARIDVYGLGMTAAFVLHGADLPSDVLLDAAGFIARLPCDEPLKRILQRAVARESSKRFADAASFCRALREYVERPQRSEASRQVWGPAPASRSPSMVELVEPGTETQGPGPGVARLGAAPSGDQQPSRAAEPRSVRDVRVQTREHIQLVLQGDVTQIDSQALQQIVEEARAATGDPGLSVVSIRPGSILLELDVSADGAAMLKRLFESGDLKSIGGIPILAIKHDHPRVSGPVPGATLESPEAALADFFTRAFAAEEIRHLVRSFSDGARLDAALPGASASLSHLASEAVRVLVRHDLVGAELFARLEAERPRRWEEIRQISRLFEG